MEKAYPGVRLNTLIKKGGIGMKQPDMYGIKRFLRPVVYGIVAGTVACFLLLTFMSVVMQFQPSQPAVYCTR